jgi:serine protease Do
VSARTAVVLAVATAVASVSGLARADGGPLTPLPGTPEQVKPAAPSPVERLSRGVVTVESGGRVVAVGAVLQGDQYGRVLTALSPMGTSETADLRYADGSVVHAKIGHRDKAWDLALLVPLTGKWVDGLVASGAIPSDVTLEAPVAMHPGRPVVVPARVRGVIDARAREGNGVLASVLDVELQGATPTLGAPLTDTTAGVVGVFVRACQQTLPTVLPSSGPAGAAPTPAAPPPLPPCVPIVVAAPVAAIRDFLSRTPTTAVAPTPWLGIEGASDAESNTRGVRVMAFAPDSPAQKAGLHASSDKTQADLIVAVDGQPVDTPEHLADLISRHAIGEHVKLLLITAGKFREAVVVLRAAP